MIYIKSYLKKMQREDFPEFKRRVAACVRKSQEEC